MDAGIDRGLSCRYLLSFLPSYFLPFILSPIIVLHKFIPIHDLIKFMRYCLFFHIMDLLRGFISAVIMLLDWYVVVNSTSLSCLSVLAFSSTVDSKNEVMPFQNYRF